MSTESKTCFMHCIKGKLQIVEGGTSNLQLINGCVMTISSQIFAIYISVSSVVEYPGAASSWLRTINSELNGAT